MIKVRLQVGKNNEEKVKIFNDEVKNTDYFFTLDGIKKQYRVLNKEWPLLFLVYLVVVQMR